MSAAYTTLREIKPGAVVSIDGVHHRVYFTGGAMAHTRVIGGEHRCYGLETRCVLVAEGGPVDTKGQRQGASH